jgi:hypothetical protein
LRKQRYFAVCVFLVLVALGPFLAADNQDKDGPKVVGITGHWTRLNLPPGDSRLNLTFAGTISPGECIAGDRTESVLVVLFNDRIAIPFDCKSSDRQCGTPPTKACVRSIIAPSTKSSSVGTLLAEAARRAFGESRDRYITPVSRGLEPYVTDTVVALDAERIDLAAAFQNMNPGTYPLRFESLGDDKTTYTAKLQWNNTGPAIVSIPRIRVGLYRLVRLSEAGEPAESAAWILVSPPDRYRQDAAAFESAVEATKKWPDDTDPRAPRAVLRACLELLSKGSVKEK